jgi:hypothetical protein
VTGKIDKLRRAYRHLTPFERVELLLAAGEADDWSELHALEGPLRHGDKLLRG